MTVKPVYLPSVSAGPRLSSWQPEPQEPLATVPLNRMERWSPVAPLYCLCLRLGEVEEQKVPSDTVPKCTLTLTRKLTGADGDRGGGVVSPEPAPGDTAIGDEDYRHEVSGGGVCSIEPVTNPSNERRAIFRPIIDQDIVKVAASFKPGDIQETGPFSVSAVTWGFYLRDHCPDNSDNIHHLKH